MTVIEHTKVETPKEAMKQNEALSPVQFTVGFPAALSASRWEQPNTRNKQQITKGK
jgi:hypothetical protein